MGKDKKEKRKAVEEPESGGSEDEAALAARKAEKKAAKKAKKAAAAAAEEGAAKEGGKKSKKDKKKKVEKGGGDGGGGEEGGRRGDGDGDGEEAAYRASLGISVKGGPDGTPVPPCVRSLADAPFDNKVVGAMEAAGFSEPSAIQAQAWSIASAGADLVAVAKTGSGKTLGFLLPGFKLMGSKKPKPNSPLILVLAPTRELAVQIELECQKFAKYQGVTSTCLYGGVPLGPQKAALAKAPHVVIATPGRLCDLMEQGLCKLGGTSYVVLDEADRMLDMGFEPQITKVFAALPAVGERQTQMFSATWPKAVRKMANKFLRPGSYQIFAQGGEDAELEANKAIKQVFIHATDDEKDAKLWGVLEGLKEGYRAVVFANTKRRVDYLQKALWDEGLGTAAIHGDKAQGDRDRALKSFTAGELPLLFATDVAARGLDIKGINFDMARDVESYIHRIGRTGRAGELGESVTFWNPDYDKECTPALCRIARDAGQEVPEFLHKYEKTKASKQWKVEDAVLA